MGLLDAFKQYLRDAAPGGALNPEVTRQGILDAGALATMPVPVVGDLAGLAADVNMFATDPSSRTPGNYALAGAGLLPFVPSMGLLGVIKNPQLDKSAKELFGRTYSPDETGYIMDDGFRLDFSGRHYATGYEKTPYGYKPKRGEPDYLSGSRNVDHRELGELTEEGGTEGMLKFMEDSGAVRYMRGNGITVMNNNMPSQKQIEAIVKDFRKSGYPLYIDVVKPNGYSAGTVELDRPTVESVMDFIKRHQTK